MRRVLPALVAGIAAYALYRSTLLPGVDFGDTGSFQTIVGSPVITPRAGYPLYFAIADAVVRLSGDAPGHALNHLSALQGAFAVGLLTAVAIHLTGSMLSGLGAGLLFAVSYTFWSQAIIAEVYALHAVFVAGATLLLLRWSAKPSLPRLAAFFAGYALGFGNHLSMILLAPPFTAFILVTIPGGWRSAFRARVIALAVICALAGALQYAPSIRTLWLTPEAPRSIGDGLQHFWFDITKSDWRETMVLNVPRSMLSDHAAMYWFDLRQQFGAVCVLLAIIGLFHLSLTDWRKALLTGGSFAVNLAFAYSYNVGDKHVFYLPSHLFVALLAGCGTVALMRLTSRVPQLGPTLLVAYALVRAYSDYPALDRSADRRPTGVLRALTDGIDDRHAILLTDLNWQVQNGLSYFAKMVKPEVAFARMPDVLQYAPALIIDNHGIDRDVVLTARARAALIGSYGPLFPTHTYGDSESSSLDRLVARISEGTRYVLCVLKPSGGFRLDIGDLNRAVLRLDPNKPISFGEHDYLAVAGTVGQSATVFASDRPFRQHIIVGGVPVELRMDAWLSVDTIRRMGFGHVIAAHQHTLIVERGVSFVTFDVQGRTMDAAYFAGIFAPEPRFIVERRAMVEK
jgi:transmembrane protein TMEM260 (protein O-mannosyltransferase)